MPAAASRSIVALGLVLGIAPVAVPAQRPEPVPPAGSAPTPATTPATAQTAATPQLITVRPREPLRFDAQLVVPTYYDRTFWPSILAGFEIAAPRAAPPPGDSVVESPRSAPVPASRVPASRVPARAPR